MLHSTGSSENQRIYLSFDASWVRETCGPYSPGVASHPPQVLGLFADFILRMAGLPTPFSMLANLPFAGTQPKLS